MTEQKGGQYQKAKVWDFPIGTECLKVNDLFITEI